MDNIDAFERQVAGEMLRRAGPILPVDDAAILAAITATRAPTRSIPRLLGAVRFAVAGAVLAALGGVLVIVVMTQPRDEDRAPAVGGPDSSASPSTVVSPPPTEAARPSPSPSPTEAVPAPSTSSSIPKATTTKFAHPFRYAIPDVLSSSPTYEDSEVFTLLVGDEFAVERSPRLFGGVQASAKVDGEGGVRGILIANVTGAEVSTCSLENPRSSFGPSGSGPNAFLDSLQEIGGLRLEDRTATSFGGRPAIVASPVWSRCSRTEIIIGTRPIWEAFAPVDIPSRLIVADVGDRTIMAQIWAGTQIDLEEWLPVAQELIDSVEFLEDGEFTPVSDPPHTPPS